MSGLGAYIRKHRDERDLSLRELAKRLGISAAFLSDIELGRRYPSEEVLVNIAHVLGIKIDDLRAEDLRAPIEDIKRITEADPRFALAFRAVINSKISADELLALAKRKQSETRHKSKR